MRLRTMAGLGLVCLSTIAAVACSSAPTASGVDPRPQQASASAEGTVPPAGTVSVHARPASDPRVEWRRRMARSARPKDGCFVATHPSETWVEVPCIPAPATPLVPAKTPPGRIETVGAQYGDFSAVVSGTMSWAEGSFPSVVGVTSESANGNANAYSLQLNTNRFTTPLCGGAPGCVGWEQFVYEGGGGGFIQYWLIDYPNSCPDGWDSTSLAPGDCYRNDNHGTPAPAEAITDLGQLTVTATAGTSDTLTISVDDGTLYTVSQPTILGLNAGWTTAEFNVFGDDDSHEAVFNSGATVTVQTLVDTTSGSTNAPSCVDESLTGETNNLTLVPSCCLALGDNPGITFEESNVAGASCSLCGGEGQSCCSTGNACASANDVCSGGSCQACGGNGQFCCAGNTCTTAGDVCQPAVDACGPPDALTASPSALSVNAGDGTNGGTTVTTNLVPSGLWSYGQISPTLTLKTTSVPAGVALPASGKLPTGLTWGITNDTDPPTVAFTAASATAAGTYEFAITGTIPSYTPATATVKLTVSACAPLTCSDAHWECGSFDNGCGGTSSCGSCPSGESCTAGGCFRCAERTCPDSEFFNLSTCECQACACGTIDVDGKKLCAVCKI